MLDSEVEVRIVRKVGLVDDFNSSDMDAFYTRESESELGGFVRKRGCAISWMTGSVSQNRQGRGIVITSEFLDVLSDFVDASGTHGADVFEWSTAPIAVTDGCMSSSL